MGTMLADSVDQIFVSNVIAAMERKGISKSELARLSGIDRSYLSDFLNGHHKNIGLQRIARLAAALDVEVPTLFSRSAID